MILFLVIYLLGVVAAAVFMYLSLEKGQEVTVSELVMAFFTIALSWIAIPILLCVLLGDHVVFTKK